MTLERIQYELAATDAWEAFVRQLPDIVNAGLLQLETSQLQSSASLHVGVALRAEQMSIDVQSEMLLGHARQHASRLQAGSCIARSNNGSKRM